MGKDEQIEEMIAEVEIANVICGKPCDICKSDESKCIPYRMARKLVAAGYRKQSEGEWLSIQIPTGVEAFGIREEQAYPKCSLCGYMGDVSEWHANFCPHCGAKMKGD